MDTRTIFQLLKHLTCQTNIINLIASLQELLVANFSGVQVIIYELQANRCTETKEQKLICIDCLREAPHVNLTNESDLYQAYTDKEMISHETDNNKTVVILPVELFDKTISHLIRIEHPYKHESAIDLLLGLMEIFTDIFRNLHEKGYDPLTRILNRQAFDQAASSLAYANKLPKHHTSFDDHNFSSIAILDIDKFKAINDHYGHAIGDETLVLFAQTVRAVLRQDDLFFRYGGEEFVVFIKQADGELAANVLERCRHAVEEKRFPQVGQVTVSIGIAELTPDCHPLESLSKADKALYYIKKNGRNQVLSYEHLLNQGLLEAVEPIEGSVDFWD